MGRTSSATLECAWSLALRMNEKTYPMASTLEVGEFAPWVIPPLGPNLKGMLRGIFVFRI